MTFWSVVFWVAAAFNMAVGGALLLGADAIVATFGGPAPGQKLIIHTAALLIMVFGLGYAMVARNLRAHTGIVSLGVVGKLTMPIIGAIHYAQGEIPLNALLLTLGDLVFAVLFVIFLRQSASSRSIAA